MTAVLLSTSVAWPHKIKASNVPAAHLPLMPAPNCTHHTHVGSPLTEGMAKVPPTRRAGHSGFSSQQRYPAACGD